MSHTSSTPALAADATPLVVVDVAVLPWRGALEPAVHSAKARRAVRRGFWLRVSDDAGAVGYGEAAPLPGYGGGATAQVAAALQALMVANGVGGGIVGGGIVGARFVDAASIAAAVAERRLPPAAGHALEQVLLELLAQRRGLDVANWLGAVPSSAPPPLQTLVADAAAAASALASGATALKLKVGGRPLAEDLGRVSAIAAAIAQSGRAVALRLDANGAWSAVEAEAACAAFAPFGIAWIEEPLRRPTPDALARLRQRSGVGVAVDESCRSLAALEAYLAADALDAVIVKPMCVGGLAPSAAMARRARAEGVAVVVTTCLDGPVAEAAVLAVARAAGDGVGVGLDRRLRLARPAPAPLASSAYDMPHPLAAAARARPDADAIVADDAGPGATSLRYRDLAARAASFAGWLRDLGVEAGDRVALIGPYDAAFVCAIHGVGWRGAVAAPMSTRATLAERGAALEALQPALVLAADGVAVPAGPWRVRALPTLASDAPAWTAAPAPEPWWPLSAKRLALQTSGSAGRPQTVLLDTAQLAFSALGSALRLGHLPSDRWLACLPLHHVGGLAIVLRAAFAAVAIELHAQFDAARLAARLDSGDIALASLVPAQLARVLDARPAQPMPQALRALLLGGAPADEALVVRAAALRLPLCRTWGMTEAGSQIATAAPGELEGGAGAPLAFARVETDADGALVVRGPIVAGGRLVTSDAGRIDAEGRVHVEGRRDRVLVRGGVNVAPEPIERALRRHPSVADALVVGLPSARSGEEPAAAIVLRQGQRLDSEALRLHLAATLAPAAWPTRYVALAALPTSALGKPQAAAVRALLLGAEHAEAAQPLEQHVGGAARTESCELDEGVHVAQRGAQAAIGLTDELEGEGDGARRQRGDRNPDSDALAEAHRRLVVGLGVDQRHAPALGVKDASEAGGAEQLFEGLVGVLEGAREVGDAGAIDVGKADGAGVGVGHHAAPRRRSGSVPGGALGSGQVAPAAREWP